MKSIWVGAWRIRFSMIRADKSILKHQPSFTVISMTTNHTKIVVECKSYHSRLTIIAHVSDGLNQHYLENWLIFEQGVILTPWFETQIWFWVLVGRRWLECEANHKTHVCTTHCQILHIFLKHTKQGRLYCIYWLLIKYYRHSQANHPFAFQGKKFWTT